MPVHDWTQVDAGTFHDFHSSWLVHLKEALNGGPWPAEYYAVSEQHAGHSIADVLTPQPPSAGNGAPPPVKDGGVAVAEAPPKVSSKLVPSPIGRGSKRSQTVRHVSGHRVVALLEIASPANKDRAARVAEFVDKAKKAHWAGVHLQLLDLFPPGPHDPRGLHGALWECFDDEQPYAPPADQPLTLAFYVADPPRPVFAVYVEPLAVGGALIDMPLFLDLDRYVIVPLEATYAAAFRGLPAFWRGRLEGGNPA